MIRRLFTRHPNAVGQGYFEHQMFAFSIATRLLAAGGAALAHGVFPFLFVTTAGKSIEALHHRLHSRPQPGGLGTLP